MMRTYALIGAAADISTALFAFSEGGAGVSVSMAVLTAASLALSLGGVAAALRCLAGHELPAVMRIEETPPRD